MLFFLDADFPDKTTILESCDWEIRPTYDSVGIVNGYNVRIGDSHLYPIDETSYKRLLNAFRDNRPVSKVYLCRTKAATTDRIG